ncbi:GerAB/ArcD/ProY family transporter [Paenibacillus sp. HJGM_3]|uniref:GerAB/ArcD/ProY family transporter n=1 Tax=Paenibacillus sp. HJGM_3 TaxID=3379816 RepID=UPI00385BC88D
MSRATNISPGQYGIVLVFATIAIHPFGEQMLLYQTTGRFSWLAICIAYLLSVVSTLLATWMMKPYTDDNVIGVIRRLFGRAVSWGFALMFVLAGVAWGGVYLRQFWTMIHATQLKQTPVFVTNLIMMLAVVALVWHGIEGFARASQLLALFLVPAMLLLLTGLIQNANFARLLPLSDPPWGAFMEQRVLSFFFAFKGTLVPFFFMPYLRHRKHIQLWGFASLTLAFLFIGFIITLPLAIFHVDAVKIWILPIQKSVGTVLLPFFPIHKISFLTPILWHMLVMADLGIMLLIVTQSLGGVIRLRREKTVLLLAAACTYLLSLFPLSFIQVVQAQIYLSLYGAVLFFALPVLGACMKGLRRGTVR